MEGDLLETSVLIVDDSSLNIRVISNIISPLGYKVFIAKSGRQALTLLSKCSPTLIVMDITMPEMSGFECCEEIKKMKSHAQTPIIFVTGSHDMQDISRAQALGACSYITKPVDPDLLIEQLGIYSPFTELPDRINASINA